MQAMLTDHVAAAADVSRPQCIWAVTFPPSPVLLNAHYTVQQSYKTPAAAAASLQVKDTEELEFLKGRAAIIDEMEAMLMRLSLRAINQAMLPYIHFLLPAGSPTADNAVVAKSEETETTVEAAAGGGGGTEHSDDTARSVCDMAGLQALLQDVLEQCKSLKEEQQQQAKLLQQLQPQAAGAYVTIG
jgi:hypothetical protein